MGKLMYCTVGSKIIAPCKTKNCSSETGHGEELVFPLFSFIFFYFFQQYRGPLLVISSHTFFCFLFFSFFVTPTVHPAVLLPQMLASNKRNTKRNNKPTTT